MKLRTIIFFAALALLIFAAFYIKNEGLLFASSKKGKIAPYSEWPDIIKSTWKFEYHEKSKDYNWLHKGDIVFMDSTFDLYLNIKDLNERMDGSEGQGGGHIKGVYFFPDDTTFTIESTKCTIEANKDFYIDEFCKYYKLQEFKNGYLENMKLEVLEFNNKKIRITGKLFKDDADIEYLFTRNEE